MLKTTRGSLVAAKSLIEALKSSAKVRVLNTTVGRPLNDVDNDQTYKKERIPGATMVDIDQVHDASSGLTHQTPLEKEWNDFMKKLDIRKDDTLVLYDDYTLAGPSKFWWSFKQFGKDVYVLEGCFDAWKKEGGKVEVGEVSYKNRGGWDDKQRFALTKGAMMTYHDVNAVSYMIRNKSLDYQIVDARAGPRFRSEVDEPRPGLRRGNIPGSRNLFFKDLLTADLKSFKTNEELIEVFQKAGIDLKKPMVMSCGSSVTASVIDYAMDLIGIDTQRYIYQPSWSEYGKTPQISDSEIIEKCIPKSQWFKNQKLSI